MKGIPVYQVVSARSHKVVYQSNWAHLCRRWRDAHAPQAKVVANPILADKLGDLVSKKKGR